MTETIAASDVQRRLCAGTEIALLDMREIGEHARGHPLFAASLPPGRLELEIDRLVPRRGTLVALLDDGAPDDRAMRAAERLASLGYGDARVLEGGLAGWRAAGLEVFDGVHVPSKAFGEAVEAERETPSMTARELHDAIAAGRNIVVVDCRPFDEYRRMTVPGAVCVPGAELVHRARSFAPDRGALVAVTCAGRTRSIVGAQSLIDAGAPNPVVALENGTMGWELAGLPLERSAGRRAPPLTGAARAWAQEAAMRAGGSRVRFACAETFDRWRREADERTLYLFDVRSAEEYEAGHLPGSRHAPGGQLVQATDSYAPVRGARIVLADDDGARASMTALWLLRMGWRDVRVLAPGAVDDDLETGPEPARVPGLTPARRAFEIDVMRVAGMLPGRDMVLVDFAGSRRHRAGHIPGALWGLRSRMARLASRLPEAPMAVLTSPDSLVAHLAAPELGKTLRCPVRVLRGGTDAWKAAGFPLETGAAGMLDDPDDDHPAPYDLPPARAHAAMRAYLEWEAGLPARIARDSAARFRLHARDAV